MHAAQDQQEGAGREPAPQEGAMGAEPAHVMSRQRYERLAAAERGQA